MKTFNVRVFMLSHGDGGIYDRDFAIEAPDAADAREHALSMLRPHQYDNRLWVECDGIRVAPPVNVPTIKLVSQSERLLG